MRLSKANSNIINPELTKQLEQLAVTLVFENGGASPFFKSQILEIKAFLESSGIPVTVYGLSTSKDSDGVQPELRMMNLDLTLSDETLSDLPPPDPEKPSGTSNNPFLWGVIRIRPVIWVVIWVSFQKRGC